MSVNKTLMLAMEKWPNGKMPKGDPYIAGGRTLSQRKWQPIKAKDRGGSIRAINAQRQQRKAAYNKTR